MTPFVFTVDGPAVPWERATPSKSRRIDGRGKRMVTPPRTRAYQKHVAQCAMAAMFNWRTRSKENWNAAQLFSVAVDAYLPDRKIRDASNILKTIEDALNKVIWNDDSQLWNVQARKIIDRDNPRVVVTVTEWVEDAGAL